ncbi:bifunctional hydroxymethylpyrimidine kinase/phosphomethylpyrimidine kinase [Paenibacillus sp. CAU 1782]
MAPIAKALTIAGSDSGGGAGIQADLKTFQELGVYGMSALTAVTAQNTLGVHGVYPVDTAVVTAQLHAIGSDLPPDAVKTGMLFSHDRIEAVAEAISYCGWGKIVVDPVMIAKGGALLLQSQSLSSLKASLLPLAEAVTPNIPEAELLANMPIATMEDRKEASRRIAATGVRHVILKGGHSSDAGPVIDLLYDGVDFYELEGARIQTRHTHGTGCTFSAALTAGLAQGHDMLASALRAKAFIQAAIEDGLHLGAGHGPTNHFAYKNRISSILNP